MESDTINDNKYSFICDSNNGKVITFENTLITNKSENKKQRREYVSDSKNDNSSKELSNNNSNSDNTNLESQVSQSTSFVNSSQPDYTKRESKILIMNYGKDIFQELDSSDKSHIPHNFLKRHPIEIELFRMKMVDWMIEVFSKVKSDLQTFYLAVYLMDSYLHKSPGTIKPKDIHIIGLTCIYIASKFEEVDAIKMNTIIKFSHNAYTKYIKFTQKRHNELGKTDSI